MANKFFTVQAVGHPPIAYDEDRNRMPSSVVETGSISSNNTVVSSFLAPTDLVIGDLVTINLSDGGIRFGEKYEPTQAAEMFWQSIVGEYREFLKWKEANKA